MLKILHPFKVFALAATLTFLGQLQAQDIHYSQFGRSPLNINPALTGLFKGDLRFIGNYRSQWNKVPVNYMTFSGGFDQKFINTSMKNSLFSAGIYFNHDEAGDLELSNTGVNLSGSFTRRLTEKQFLTAGIQIGGAQRKFDITQLRVDAQFNGDQFNGALSTQENFVNSSIFYVDLSGGINYRLQNFDKRQKVDVGVAVFHANTPNNSFFENSPSALEARWSFYGMTSFGIGKLFDIGAQAIAQFQGPHQEILVGGTGKIHLNQQPDSELAFGLGLSHRIGDSWIPSVIIDYRMWSIGFSYDVNTSDFNDASFRRGGPELSAIYIFSKVRPPKEFEICPLF
ncbi:MAG: PorP/SprF family type IX secretion system membrane protein [Bacteroidota bacterium]